MKMHCPNTTAAPVPFSVFVAILLNVALASAYGQTAISSPAAAKPPAKEAQAQSGYLTKAPPKLRFAPPPKPPVASLLPLPITFDPQPVFSPDFAQPLADLQTMVAQKQIPPPPQSTVVPVLDLTSQLPGGKDDKIPAGITSTDAVSPQMLIKFFQNSKPAEVEMLMANPVNFRLPIPEEKRSSSATYEIK